MRATNFLDLYFERIRYSRSPASNLETLRDLHLLHLHKIDPALPIDMAMANFYTANSPDHIFLDAVMGTRMTERGRVTLHNHTFKVFDLIEGTVERETVTDFDAYTGKLQAHLGVELDEKETALLEPRFAALALAARDDS